MTPDTINNAVEHLFEEQIDFLKSLVRVPSTRGHEMPAQQLIAQKMQSMGAFVDKFGIDLNKISHLPGFSPVTTHYDDAMNVVGQFGNLKGKGRSLIMNGHMDVVPEGPLDRWQNLPYEPVVKNGRMYGRGTADMKAGLSAKIYALAALQHIGLQPDAPVYLQSVIEEECTGNGALACLDQGYMADAVLIGEPFNDLVRAQIGVIWFQITLNGHPGHALQAGSQPNIIEAIAPLLKSLRELERHWNQTERRHPAYAHHEHPIHLNIGEVHGGEWTSSVPAKLTLNLRLAIYPGDSIKKSQRELEEWLTRAVEKNHVLKAIQPEIDYHGFLAEGYYLEPGSDAEALLKSSHLDTLGRELEDNVITATTDARFFGLYQDTPTLVYGPAGSDIHGFNEYVELNSLLEVTQVYANFIHKWCGVRAIA